MTRVYSPARVPANTYRLQITRDFDLFAAARRLPYLRDLGVDWVYLSPLLAAEPGSDHGYDVVAHDRIDESRGGAEGLSALSAQARRLGLGVLVDLVPNHMGVATPAENAWWWDVLTHGRGSAYADFFDIDWEAGAGQLLVPIIGDGDEDAIEVADGEVRYHDHRFPLAPGTHTLEEQHYRLVSWREADHHLNYRRFFAVNTLAAVRVEEARVLAATHVEIKRWFDDGLIDGLRVDHPDGLRDPQGYLDDLAAITGGAYVLVEKILEPGERLEPGWATSGTTGYDVLGCIDRVLTDPTGQAGLDELESRLRGVPVDWHQLIHDTKRAVADGILGSEVRRIVRELVAGSFAAAQTPLLVDAIAELLACFPVYRSYLPEGRRHLGARLRARTGPPARPQRDPRGTRAGARRAERSCSPALPADQRHGDGQRGRGLRVLPLVAAHLPQRGRRRPQRVRAVGGRVPCGDDRPAGRVAAGDDDPLHPRHQARRGRPRQDRRARRAPSGLVRRAPGAARARPAARPGFGALLWQAILGAWPASRDRLHAYAEKAMREAGDHTTWTAPNAPYEAAVHAAVDAAFDDDRVSAVVSGLMDQVTGPGWSNALSAKLLSLTVPGVPDVYQGSELWEQSLVDPDNRRPVDFDHRAGVLAGSAEDDASAKLRLTRAALTLRRDRPDLFTSYAVVPATGSAADHLVAFDRGGAITVVTRLPVGLERRGGWDDTVLELPPGSWRDVVSDRVVTSSLAELLGRQPVALLVRDE